MTITKCRNHLKADVVEALQILHFMFQQDLIFCEPAPTSVLEAELEMELIGEGGDVLLLEESDFEV